MPDTKITALAAITTVDPAADVLPIVDISDTSMAASGTTKKITSNQILGSGGTATLASATITGDLTVRTNKLAVTSTGVGIGTATLFGDLNIQNGSNCRLEVTSQAGGTTIENLNNARNAYLNMTMFADAYIWNRLGSEAMRLNSTGLGVGVSPSYQIHARKDQAAFTTVAVDNQNAIAAGTGTQFLLIDGGVNAGWFRRNRDGSGNTDIGYKDTLRFRGQIAGTERTDLMIDSSGNVGIGVTPSALWNAAFKALQIGSSNYFSIAAQNTAASRGSLLWNAIGSGDEAFVYRSTGDAANRFMVGSGFFAWYTAPSGTAGNAITFTQAMTLDASGNLLVGTTTSASSRIISSFLSSSGNLGIKLIDSQSNNTAVFANFSNGTGTLGTITNNNNAGVLYNTISDYRLKESVTPLSGGLARVNALKPSIYKWKSSGSSGEGFLAHELAEVVPFAVSGEKDAVNADGSIKSQGIDMSRVVPILVAAIQELAAEVNALKNA